jgi:hypothetical protein
LLEVTCSTLWIGRTFALICKGRILCRQKGVFPCSCFAAWFFAALGCQPFWPEYEYEGRYILVRTCKCSVLAISRVCETLLEVFPAFSGTAYHIHLWLSLRVCSSSSHNTLLSVYISDCSARCLKSMECRLKLMLDNSPHRLLASIQPLRRYQGVSSASSWIESSKTGKRLLTVWPDATVPRSEEP